MTNFIFIEIEGKRHIVRYEDIGIKKSDVGVQAIFNEVSKTIPENVKIIAILLVPFWKHIKTWGKCRIFNKKKSKMETYWKRIGYKKDDRLSNEIRSK